MSSQTELIRALNHFGSNALPSYRDLFRSAICEIERLQSELCRVAAENYALQTDLAIIKREKANVINKFTVGDVTTMPAPEEMIGKGITDYHTLPKSEEVIELPLGSEFAYPISKTVVIKV